MHTKLHQQPQTLLNAHKCAKHSEDCLGQGSLITTYILNTAPCLGQPQGDYMNAVGGKHAPAALRTSQSRSSCGGSSTCPWGNRRQPPAMPDANVILDTTASQLADGRNIHSPPSQAIILTCMTLYANFFLITPLSIRSSKVFFVVSLDQGRLQQQT